MSGSDLVDRSLQILGALRKRRSVKLALLGIAFVLSIKLVWNLQYPTATWRYRLSLTIEGHNETYNGSGVFEVAEWRTPKFLPDVRPTGHSIYGEAIFIEMKDGKNLVLTLGNDRTRQLSSSALYVSQKAFLYGHPTRKFTDLPRVSLRTEIPLEWLPLLVTFQDVSDPNSYRVVNPIDLTIASDEGLRIVSAMVETTRDPVTIGINEMLPFMKNMDRADGDSSKIKSLGDWRQPIHLALDTR